MKKYIILICTVLILSLVGPYCAFADSTTYLSDEEGLELDWAFTETPPKRPQPKILNPSNYEVKWKIDNKLMHDIILDQQGVVYTSDSKDIVRAIYPNGKEKWRIHLDMGFEISVIYLVIGQDGTLYAHSSDSFSEKGLSTFYALSPEGKIKWKLQSQDIYSVFNSQFAGDAQGNFVFFTKEGLTSRNARGEVNWINKAVTSSAPNNFSQNSHKASLFMDAKGNLYLDSILGEVISLDQIGVERWRTKSLQYVNKFSGFQPYFSAKGLLYLLTEDGLHAINTNDGSSLDKMKVDIRDIQSSGVPMDGQGGYYINFRGRLLNINVDGIVNWEYKGRVTEKNGIGSDPIADKEGNVYFNTGVGNIIALNSKGQELFVFLRNAFWSKLDNLILDNNRNIISTLDDIGLVSFGKKQIQVYIDNLSLPLTAAPINHEGTVLVPFRSLFENAGLKVSWDPDLKTITGTKEGLSIQLTIGDKTAIVNGQAQELNISPLIENNNTFVPLRFVGEALGRKVTWDGDSSSINIENK